MKSTLRIICLLVALVLISGCRTEEKSKPRVNDLPTVEVRTVTVTAHTGQQQTEIVGTVRSVDQAVIASKLTGTIEDMPVVLGSTVKAGDLLVKISAEEVSARADQTQAQLEQARRNLEREKKLLQKQAATAENVKSLEDIYRVSEAAHHETLTMLSYTAIKAPFDGIITHKHANTGDLATPGSPLLQLENNSKLQVVASVPEALILQIQLGDPLPVFIPAADRNIIGAVAEIAPAADPLSRTAIVKINIEPDPLLRSGQFTRVVIPGEEIQSLFVPSTAIQPFGQMERIFVISENKAHLRLVRTGAVQGSQTEILAGLEPGEIIVAANTAMLTDGQPVQIIK